MKTCLDCGSTKNLQKHHVSYNPEVTIDLCIDCHQKRHPHHGVGVSSFENKLEGNKKDFRMLWKKGVPYKELTNIFDVSIVTIYNWSRKLDLPIRGENAEKKQNRAEHPMVKLPAGLIEDLNNLLGGENYINNSELVRDVLGRYLKNNREEAKA